jgi:hypothetical protein
VVAWFTRGAAYEYLKEGTGPGSITTGSVTAVSGRTGPAVDGTSGSVTYPAAQGYYVTLGPDSEYASDSNGDGYFPTNFTGTDSGLREWSFKLDTTLLADGVLTLHYLVYDAAGNVSYYTQEITIMNNPPAIDEVVLVTDPLGLSRLDFEPLDEAERHKVIRENWHDTGFKVWSNQLAFRVKTLDGRGNGRMHYRIFPATRVEAETSALVVGDIYTIKSLGTGVPWDDLGAPSLRSDDGGTHFMAKAATTADTSGKVWKYVVPHESLKKTTDGPAASGQYHDAVSFTYSGADFGSGKINPAAADNLYWFIIKVWDSVHPSNAEADQLSDFVVVGLDVLGPEAVKPAIQLYDPNPYTETTVIDNNATPEAKAATLDEALDPVSSARNRERGGLYNTGTSTELRRSGHIDPKNGTTAALTAADKPASPYTSSANYAVDKISGKVILRGSASDNRRIDKINLKIGAAAAVTVFERVDGVLAAKSPYSGKIVETMNWSTGNQVEWALLWDSETLRDTDNAVIKSNLAVELIAADSSANANTQTTAADNHSKITVDLVPYITGFKRDGTKLSSRSKQGWFSFDRGESNITVEGFNLTNAKSGVSLSVGGVAATVNYTTEETAPPYTVKVNLAATAAPGVIAYTPAPLNAGNDDSKSWNSFYHPNTSGSKLWQDNLNAHIWVSDHAVTLGSDRTYMGQDNSANTSEEAEYVGMAMGTGNKLYGSFSVYATTGVYIADNQNGARISLQHGAYEPSRETDISVAASSGDRSVVYNYVRDYDTAQQSGINYSSSGTGTRVEYAYYNAGRFMNPRITYNNGSTYRYITYYDAHTKQLRYARNATPVSLDGADVSADTAHINGVNGTPDPAHSSDAGLWSAVDYLSDNYPIVAYYDAANTTLRLMYAYQSDNPGALNTAGTTWRRQYVMDSGDAYYAKSGEYVSMKVQRVSAPTGTAAAHVYTDIIHLAFYNAEYKTVVYAKGTWNNTNKKWDFTTTAVDNHIKSVAWTDISLDNGKNPWITYGDGNRLGNYDGAKIAYLNSTQFNRTSTDENDSAKGNTGWEAMYVPSRYIVKNGRINIEAYPAASPPNWIAAVGYQSDRFRIAYMIKE